MEVTVKSNDTFVSLPTLESSKALLERFDELHEKRKQKKANALQFVSVVKGTCEDMCPEYERHEREVHFDLSPFEMIPGTEKFIQGDFPRINHSRAVKKYQRAAAGLETPLPEDIRPLPVLKRTMDYLVHQLLDRKDVAFAEIYKFVRDRTRSIRQDLTLQHERDVVSVEIHERIARFHILSGHRLIEESPADYDAFQNTEQLRKVLQSLSEFYHDIYNERHVSLPNEAEFRAYYILTHLQDADVLRKCLSFPSDVFQSPAVQFALQIFSAFHENNYIRFFKLLSKATYLNACLMHSHIAILQSKALSAMQQVYPTNTFISWSYLLELLGFESPEHIQHVAQSLSIDIVPEEKGIRFSRPIEENPNVLPRKFKSHRWVESKCQNSSNASIVDIPSVQSLALSTNRKIKNSLVDSSFNTSNQQIFENTAISIPVVPHVFSIASNNMTKFSFNADPGKHSFSNVLPSIVFPPVVVPVTPIFTNLSPVISLEHNGPIDVEMEKNTSTITESPAKAMPTAELPTITTPSVFPKISSEDAIATMRKILLHIKVCLLAQRWRQKIAQLRQQKTAECHMQSTAIQPVIDHYPFESSISNERKEEKTEAVESLKGSIFIKPIQEPEKETIGSLAATDDMYSIISQNTEIDSLGERRSSFNSVQKPITVDHSTSVISVPPMIEENTWIKDILECQTRDVKLITNVTEETLLCLLKDLLSINSNDFLLCHRHEQHHLLIYQWQQEQQCNPAMTYNSESRYSGATDVLCVLSSGTWEAQLSLYQQFLLSLPKYSQVNVLIILVQSSGPSEIELNELKDVSLDITINVYAVLWVNELGDLDISIFKLRLSAMLSLEGTRRSIEKIQLHVLLEASLEHGFFLPLTDSALTIHCNTSTLDYIKLAVIQYDRVIRKIDQLFLTFSQLAIPMKEVEGDLIMWNEWSTICQIRSNLGQLLISHVVLFEDERNLFKQLVDQLTQWLKKMFGDAYPVTLWGWKVREVRLNSTDKDVFWNVMCLFVTTLLSCIESQNIEMYIEKETYLAFLQNLSAIRNEFKASLLDVEGKKRKMDGDGDEIEVENELGKYEHRRIPGGKRWKQENDDSVVDRLLKGLEMEKRISSQSLLYSRKVVENL